MGAILSPSRQSRCSFLDYFRDNLYFYVSLKGNTVSRGTVKLTGTVSGALPSNGDSRSVPCYYFDGSNDRIDFGANTLIPHAASHSLFCWCKPMSNVNGGRIVEQSRGAGGQYLAAVWGGAYFGFTIYGASGWTSAYSNLSYPCQFGRWYLVSYSYNHPAALTHCYVNGRLFGIISNNRNSGYSGAYNSWVGGNANNADPIYQWNGKLSEFGVLSRHTSPREHIDYFQASGSPTKKVFSAGYAADAAGGSAVPVFQSNYSRRRRAA